MSNLRTTNEELLQIGILHDVVEDTDVTLDDLHKLGFSDTVINVIDCISKRKYSDGTKEEYEDYKIRVLLNDLACRVKLADLEDNTNLRRQKGVSEKDFEVLVKYNIFYNQIVKKLGIDYHVL